MSGSAHSDTDSRIIEFNVKQSSSGWSTGSTADTNIRAVLGSNSVPTEPRMKTTKKTSRNAESYVGFHELSTQIRKEALKLDDFLNNDLLTDESNEVITEIGYLLEKLYICKWGQDDCLKKVVVLITSQISNIHLTSKHVLFLQQVSRILQSTYLVNEDVVEEVWSTVEAAGLDLFRGTISDSQFRKKYRIQEIE